MGAGGKHIELLQAKLEKNRESRKVISLDEYFDYLKSEPQRTLRNIFQLVYDMMKAYVGEGVDEYPNDPESIGFVKYDCSKIFVEGTKSPFFADRLFANRFVRQIEALKQGSQQNRIYIYEGPPGCGKSTFLNNLLRSFEKYTQTKDGQSFEIFWDIEMKDGKGKMQVPCPSHDYPILLIPKEDRVVFLEELFSGESIGGTAAEFKQKLFREKEYEWVFDWEACTICKSLFSALLDKLGSISDVLLMVKARTYNFDRGLGEGISVFNPGDKSDEKAELFDRRLQRQLDVIFGTNAVRYVFSRHARTNNGIYVLMDVKSHNHERLLELHNIVSEGVHKIYDVEERINSLFFALMNPEDIKSIADDKFKSFQARIQYNKIRYVMEVATEVSIYHSIFGRQIEANFLPRILENFAKVIIASRMKPKCAPLENWIPDISKYKRYCDAAGLLLRMEIYGGVIPTWLSEEDRKKFTMQIRLPLIEQGEEEGSEGFTGRDSIVLFGDFFARYSGKPNLINMKNITDFFKYHIGSDKRDRHLPPKGFIDSLVDLYNYTVLNEVKESLYFYNKDQIVEHILHFLFASNYDIGNRVKCKFTGKEVDVTMDFFKLVNSHLTGRDMNDREVARYVKDIQKRYSEVIGQDRNVVITDTELYKELFDAYTRNLKESAFKPILKNQNFSETVSAYGTKEFEAFDTRLKEHVAHMVENLKKKFGYTEQGAKEICLYVIDQKLVEKFPRSGLDP